MQKVLVIGPGGSGKSTLSRRLAEVSGLPLIHLDSHYWRAGWRPTPKQEWREVVRSLLSRPRWIMDGNYGGTMDERIAAADTIIYLDWPRLSCMWGLIKRRVQYWGRANPSMPAGCPERLTPDFLFWVWTYPERRRPGILKTLAGVSHEKTVITLTNGAERDRFLEDCVSRAGGAVP